MNTEAAPFLILALPRSQTAWCSAFLSTGGWTCHHEPAMAMRSMADVRWFFAQPKIGAAEGAIAPGFELVRHIAPRVRTVVIRRPVDDVVDALLNLDLGPGFHYERDSLRRMMLHLDRALVRIAKEPLVLTLDYADLQHEAACRAMWTHCLDLPWSQGRWDIMRRQNIQTDQVARLRYYHAHFPAIQAFKRDVWREMRRLVRDGAIRRARHAER